MENNGLFGAISLCRKAGKLAMGFDPVCEDVFKGKVRLILTAQDISPKTLNRLKNSVGDLVTIESIPLSQDDLAPISRRAVAVYGIEDSGLAALCSRKLHMDKKEN